MLFAFSTKILFLFGNPIPRGVKNTQKGCYFALQIVATTQRVKFDFRPIEIKFLGGVKKLPIFVNFFLFWGLH